jgi:hypothetical protein
MNKGLGFLLAVLAVIALVLMACDGDVPLPAGIERETGSDSDFRVYHVVTVISDIPAQGFSAPLQGYQEEYLEEVGVVGAALVREVIAIPGVVHVRIRLYALSVEIAPAFDWEDVEPAVLDALVRALEKKEQLVV